MPLRLPQLITVRSAAFKKPGMLVACPSSLRAVQASAYSGKMQGGEESKRIVPRAVDAAKIETLLERTRTRLEVFVAGPYLQPSWQGDDLLDKSPSVRLRAKLRDYVRDQGYDVVLGEHNGVAEVTTESLPTVGNVAASELKLVKNADAIILIPDSPGSFCEAGAWSMIGSVCRKTLVFPNAIYEEESGYLQSALLPYLRNEHARVEWLDYEDHQRATSIAEDFLARAADRKVMESLKRD